MRLEAHVALCETVPLHIDGVMQVSVQ